MVLLTWQLEQNFMTKENQPIDANQRYSIEEVNTYLRQSRAKTYHDINAGLIAVIKDGRRTYVPGSEIIARSKVVKS